ncbi:MAG: HlyD family secretion protein [Acidobacteria bacterium]|nr:HlyD family secretion protein [Acidobacteriota bacterium]
MAQGIETKTEERQEGESLRRGGSGTALHERLRSRGFLLGVILVVGVAVFWLWQYYAIRESTDNAQIDGHIHPISAKVGGTALRVLVDNNQSVEAGAVLVEIDPQDYQVAVERAQGNLAEAEALWRASQTAVPILSETVASKLADAKAGLENARASLVAAQRVAEAAQATLGAAQARWREAQANSEKAARDLERMQQLLAEGVIAQQQYDAAKAAADANRAAVEAAQASVTNAELGVPAAESRVAQERAKLTQAEATLQAAQTAPQQVAVTRAQADSAGARREQAKTVLHQAQLNLEYATIRAPVAGVVSKRTVEVGQIVQPGQPLLVVVPLEDIWVTANFKETQLRNMHPGQKTIISVDAYGGRKYEGHVDSIAAATGAKFSLLPPENASGNFVKVVQRVPVKIVFEKGQDSEHLLRPGMSVVPTVLTR